MSSSNTKPRKHVSTLYRPLDTINQEIRLLRVGAGYDDEPVNCRLQHVKLDSIPRCAYETISYVWGNRRVRSTIYIEGRPLDVPASSARVLKAMRQGKRDRLLWIDAVCINQDDIQERNAQVAIMADIYANTSRTLVWLGESDSWTSTAVRTVGKILDDARGETKGFRDFDEIVFDRNADHWAHSTHALVGFAADKCLPSCLSSYFESAWFERIWVIQEAVLSREVVCYRGRHAVPLLDVIRAATWLMYKSRHIIMTSATYNAVVRARSFWRALDFARPDGQDLLDILSRTREFRAFEPRDRIYGVLGLYRRRDILQPLPKLIAPDYGEPLDSVVRDAASFVIDEQHGLGILREVSHQDRMLSAGGPPTWVPRWDRPTDKWDPVPLPLRFNCLVVSDDCQRIAITNVRSIRPELLVARGWIVDTISHTFPTFDWDTDWTAVKKRLRDIEVACVTDGLCSYNALAMTLTTATDHQGLAMSAATASKGYAALRALPKQRSVKLLGATMTWGSLPEEGPALEYYMALGNACCHRRVMLTASGRSVVGPKVAERRDLVAVLWGCKWPVILRPRSRSSEYMCIGVAYVHGIMNGELQMADIPTEAVRDIRIS